MPRHAAFAIALPAILSLAACGEKPAEAPVANTAAPLTGTAAKVAAMPVGLRNGVLFRAIRDAGSDCQQVKESVPADAIQGKPTWLATCDNKGQWLVSFGADDIATVIDARAAAAPRRR